MPNCIKPRQATAASAVMLGLAFTFLACGHADASDTQSIVFNRDIRPLLADKCFHCHGPDEASREADLRLDLSDDVLDDHREPRIVVPGSLSKSELYRRISASRDDLRMPPPESGQQLTESQRDLLKRWIEQSGDYKPHWAFVPPHIASADPSRPEDVSAEQSTDKIRHPIDRFVVARLREQGLRPAAEAGKRILIRRVTLDLTGLPPTPEEVEAFVADASPGAYERTVDRLLASPRFGERMALPWLDAARYADTHGYLFDTQRDMWRWRDWVIESLNANKPFDEFTIEQLAGDLLPDPTLDQLIATGFNRNHIINNEAGATPQEYLVENVLDRVNTTATVWMGLTLACAQCHDHKYDSFTQREYYQLYAFFNNIPETGLDGFNSNAKPNISAPTPDQLRQFALLDQQITDAEKAFAPVANQLKPGQEKWEDEIRSPQQPVIEGLVVHLPLDDGAGNMVSLSTGSEFKDGEATHESGMIGKSAVLDGQRYLELNSAEEFDFDLDSSFTLAAWVFPEVKQGRRTVFAKLEPPEASFRGYTLQIVEGFPTLYLLNRFPDNLIMAQAKQALEPRKWYHLAAVYDGSGKAAGTKLYVDGKLQEVSITLDTLTGPITTEKPLWVGNGHPLAKFKGRIDDARVYNRALSEQEVARLPGVRIESLVSIDQKQRSEEAVRRIQNHYLENAAPQQWSRPYRRLNELRQEKKEALREQTTVMVMKEQEKPRQTTMLLRGAYDAPGEVVTAATPAVLPAMDKRLPRNRLGLARWLTDPSHPLTARVAVNRYWQMYFGSGLVRSTDNFGVQGDSPSHPQLLDWLATEFVRSGWDIKAMQRLIVTSATYRQSSQMTENLRRTDPGNRLLARGPRHRLPAETIRDAALCVSGLLVERQGGPSVKPYQPPDLWKEVAFDTTGNVLTAQIYKQDEGPSLYRRSMYTFWKRTQPPPTMLIFDGPDRERCVVRRSRTNTPLQALVLLNDPTFVEAARHLAQRLLNEAGWNVPDRLNRGFQLALGRPASRQEVQLIQSLLQEQLQRFKKHASAAEELLSVGRTKPGESLDAAELAAWTVVASILLNLDEYITKG